MKAKLIGVNEYDFVAQDTGRHVSGCNLFVATPSPNVRGLKPKKIKCPNSVNPSSLVPDSEYEFVTDFDGRVIDILSLK